MNCKVFFRILVISTIVLISASAYAAEDHLSISPSTSDLEAGMIYARPGKIEVTISGERDSDNTTVVGVSYFVNYCCGGTSGGALQLAVKAIIEDGENPGKSTYEKKFPVYLEPGRYSLTYQIRNSSSNGDYEYVSINPSAPGSSIFLSVTSDPIPINIENITEAAITKSDTFTLKGITVPGYAETYWGTFKWNPDALSFDLMDAGVGTEVNR